MRTIIIKDHNSSLYLGDVQDGVVVGFHGLNVPADTFSFSTNQFLLVDVTKENGQLKVAPFRIGTVEGDYPLFDADTENEDILKFANEVLSTNKDVGTVLDE